jgi:hypothetical protein
MDTLSLKLKLNAFPALDGGTNYCEPVKLFYAYFGEIPSMILLVQIDALKLIPWIEVHLNYKQKHSFRRFNAIRDEYDEDDCMYVLENDLVIRVSALESNILFLQKDKARAEMLVDRIKTLTCDKKQNEIGMVVFSDGHLHTRYIDFKKPELELSRHYNDDLDTIHQKCVSFLNGQEKSGLILFHGIPGTGKSTYIRHLITSVDKNVIFMTPDLAGNLGSPEIAKYLLQHKNCVFVIEDAEQLIISRERERNSSISAILNLTDGILGETLNIQIIATFNTELYNIDKALLRKGRLHALYEFKPLEAGKSAKLLAELGHDGPDVAHPMTLAEIFNYDEANYEVFKPRVSIGFKN